MPDKYKVKAVEKNGLDLEYAEEIPLRADIVEFDPSGTSFSPTTLDVHQALIDAKETGPSAVSSGVFHWARPGASNNQFFFNYGRNPASNKVGIPIFFSPSKLDAIGVGNDNDNISFQVHIYAHSGGALNLIHSQAVTLGPGQFTKNFLNLNSLISGGEMLAAQLTYSGGFINKPKNLQITAGVVKV